MQTKAPESVVTGNVVSTCANENQFFVGGVSPAMRALDRVVANIALTDIPVLLVGESGTGKEVVAVQIHQLSPRRNEPFIKLSCASLTPESFSAWLSEAESGGGAQDSLSPGTLFLDEISELDPVCQRQLLRALPDGDTVPQTHLLRQRVISATARNLEEETRAGRFREELYYRINGVCLRLPLLRQRKEDIPALIDFFLTKYSAVFGRPRPSLSPETLSLLLNYSWPGNIRELQNTVKKMVTLGDEGVAMADLVTSTGDPQPPGVAVEKLSLKEAARAASRLAERELILKVLARTRWNRKRAAQTLQISYKALLYKLKQLEMDPSTTS